MYRVVVGVALEIAEKSKCLVGAKISSPPQQPKKYFPPHLRERIDPFLSLEEARAVAGNNRIIVGSSKFVSGFVFI